MSSTLKLLAEVKAEGSDFEWYPTTEEILKTIVKDINDQYQYHNIGGILDCGAGDGRALSYFKEHIDRGERKCYAIEKSPALLKALPKEVFVVGTDFDNQVLIDKKMSMIFCNPPYSQYEQWAEKIILEGNCMMIYLVIPSRWQSSTKIKNAIKQRGIREGDSQVLGSFDFMDADRQARAKVDILKIGLRRPEVKDSFSCWFESHFKSQETTSEDDQYKGKAREKRKKELLVSSGLVESLHTLYQEDMEHLLNQFHHVNNLDSSLLSLLGISVEGIHEALKKQIEGLKTKYWKELFDKLSTLTNRLTHNTRRDILEVLFSNSHVDFTVGNIEAVALWVIKNVNDYVEKQFIQTYERLIEEENILKYKSNKKAFTGDNWRYNKRDFIDATTNFKLDYRVVTYTYGSLELVDNLQVIAYNLGFDTFGFSPVDTYRISRGEEYPVCFTNNKGEQEELFRYRWYKNGNVHIKLNSKFILKMNVEYGRLRGWLRNKQDVVYNFEVDTLEAEESFGSLNIVDLNKPALAKDLFKLEHL